MSYIVSGQTVDTLQEVAAILEVKRVTEKDVSEGGKYAGIVTLASKEAPEDTSTHEEQAAASATESDTDAELDEDTLEADGADEGTGGPTAEYDEALVSEEEARAAFLPDGGDFKDLKDLKDVITDIDTPTLEYLAKSLGAEFVPNENAAIHRMRIAQALHRYFFPDMFQPKEPKKKKAKYGDFSDEELIKLAKTHKVKWNESQHAPINRMYLIMALKKAGHLPE